MKLFKPKFWQNKHSLISFFLLPLSFGFQFLLNLKKFFRKEKKFNIPIICVGNIYLGGTGKTPLCVEISEILKKLNIKNAIIKKYYKKHEDEFKLIESKKIKLFKNTSRSIAIREAEMQNLDCVILDDGFQDSSIIKDLNIICFNEMQLAGNEMTIPSGPLREPFSSIKKSQIIVVNGNVNEIFEKKIKNTKEKIHIFYSKYTPTNLNQFAGQDLLAFAGIGNPINFFHLLEKNNLIISKRISFPDHHDYSLEELDEMVKYSIAKKLKIVTTEKDYFRIKHHKIPQIQFLSVKLEIENKDKFEKELIKCLF